MSKLNVANFDALFFSPHLDDAVLSCGGLLAELKARKKRTLVVTLFTQGQKLASSSPDLLKFLKQSGPNNAEDLFLKRRREDRQAARLLGFDYLHLNFVDALWRTNQNNSLYPTFKELFSGKIADDDQLLIEKISEACLKIIELNKKAAIYAPLAIGHHVDHIITFKVIQTLGRKLSRSVRFWEDLPYRDQVGAREKRLADLKIIPRYFQFICQPKLAKLKESTCALYKSQIAWLKKSGLGTLDYLREGFFEL